MNWLLVENGVEQNGGLAGLTVTNDQFALATANRDQASTALRPVAMGSCTDLRGIMPGALTSTRWRCFALIGPLPSIGIAERVNHAAEQFLADGHFHDGAGPFDRVAFLDVTVGTENNDTDIVDFQVQGHAHDTTGELDHLTGLDIVQTVDTGDTVTDGQHLADLGDLGFFAESP